MMRRGAGLGFFLFFWAACCTGCGSALEQLRGVAANEQATYAASSGTYACKVGGTVPISSVNDDFCDCEDGSDEPGTSACAGQDKTLFHCENVGSSPTLIYASRIDDGVCDCCDGSDEVGFAARFPGRDRCVNNCAEVGAVERLERAKRLQSITEGIKVKDEIIEKAKQAREDDMVKLTDLRMALPALEAAAEKAKADKATTDKASGGGGGGGDSGLRKLVTNLEKKVEKQQAEITALRRDLDALRGGSKAGVAAEAADKGKPVVSEYAKWMDNSGSTPGAIEVKDPLGAALGDKDEEDYIDDEGGDRGDEDEDFSDEASSGSSSSGGSGGEDDAVKANKKETEKLMEKMQQLTNEQMGFATLPDKCITKNDGEYLYEFCFFDRAKQGSTTLGKWKGWTDSKTCGFTKGDMCPGGPHREMKVTFECGNEVEVLQVSEPSRCMYEATISHPGACNADDAASLLKPPLRHPMDEL